MRQKGAAMMVAFGLIGGVAMALAAAETANTGDYFLRSMDNPHVITPRFGPRFCDPRDSQLAAMRKEERLDEIVGDATDDWHVIGKIAAWTCARVQNGTGPVYRGPFHGPALLKAIDAGQQGFACGTFSHLFVDALASFGILGRTIGITSTSNRLTKGGAAWNHATSEVWSDRWGKWVYVDSELILYYEFGGRPLSALELQDCLKKGITPTLRHFDEAEAEKWIQARNFQWWKEAYFDQMQMINYDLDNYHMAKDFVGNGQPGGRPMLVYWPTDAPWRPHYYSDRYRYLTTADPMDVDWPVNCVKIRLPLNPDGRVAAKKGKNGLRVRAELTAYAPYPEALLVRAGQGGEWQEVKFRRQDGDIISGVYAWDLRGDECLLEARVRSALGRLGRISWVKLERAATAK